MNLTESEQNLMAQALYLAADKYLDFAADAQAIGQVRIMEQFLRQATDTRYMATLADDCEEISYSGELDAVARCSAAHTTNQKFADLLKIRAAEQLQEARKW